MKTSLWILALALLLCLLAAGLVLAHDGTTRPRAVLGSGASASAAGAVHLRATLGQPAVGHVASTGGEIRLGQGFWHGARYGTYLPLLFRDYP
jgi:hypothetical protein